MLDSLPKDQNPTPEARFSIEPYLFEAGLDPDNLYGNRKFLLDGLMVFHVIDKRHLELDDLAQGNKLSLITIIFHGFELKVESLESGK